MRRALQALRVRQPQVLRRLGPLLAWRQRLVWLGLQERLFGSWRGAT